MTQESQILTGKADDETLAALGYKQEFKRAFSPLEVCSLFSAFFPMSIDISFGGIRYRFLYHRAAAINSLSTLLFSTKWGRSRHGLGSTSLVILLIYNRESTMRLHYSGQLLVYLYY